MSRFDNIHEYDNNLDGAALRQIVELEKPHYIVPEIEALATDTLVELENEGFTVIPTARAALAAAAPPVFHARVPVGARRGRRAHRRVRPWAPRRLARWPCGSS